MSQVHDRRPNRPAPLAAAIATPLLVTLSIVLMTTVPVGAANRDRTVIGDAIKAARALAATDFATAESLTAELAAREPDSPAVRWLQSSLRFHQGDYAGAAKALDGVPDDGENGEVTTQRRLVAQTLLVTKTFVQVTSPQGHFIIRYAPGPDQAIAELAGSVLDATHQALAADLGLAPSDPIRVELLGTPTDLAKLSPLTEADIETTGTIALSKYNKLMVVSPRATIFGYPWMDTLAHEYTHLVVSRLSSETAPVWLQEGLARFLQVRWRAEPSVALTPAEHALLANALRRGRLITFDEMHPSMAKLPSQEAAGLAYAEVYALVGWIHSKVGFGGVRDILLRCKSGASVKRAVADVVGLPWPQVELAWKTYLRSLDATVKPSQLKAHQRIRFKKAGQDSENVGLDKLAKAAQKHARLAGMLRAKGKLAAAVIEYEKAHALEPTDSYVAGKLARALTQIGKFDQAIEIAGPLVKRDAHDAVAAVTLGVAKLAAKDYLGAQQAFELALAVSPFDPTTRCGLADIYDNLKDTRASRERTACQVVSQ